MKLGKTKDSRTRKKQTQEESTSIQLPKDPFIIYLLKKGYSNTTAKGSYNTITRFKQWSAQENLSIEEVSYNDILHYIQSKREQVSQRTISSEINNIKHYYNYLQHIGAVAENPTVQIQIKGIKRKVLYNILSKPELEKLFNDFEIPNENDSNKNQNWFKASILTNKRNKVILGLMIFQGLGTQELAALTTKDLKLREGKIYIAGTRKSNERELKLEAHQVLDMMEYQLQTRNEILALTKKQSDQLFVSNGESTRLINTITKLVEKLNKQNNKVTSIKQIRTSVITHWLKLYNLRQVQYMAGHRYVSSTEAYFVNDLDDLQEDITKYHPI